MPNRVEQVEIASRAELRRWLEANHAQASSIWLVTWKKGDPRYVPYGEIVEEVLCFGWIDSLPRKLDETRTMLRLSPRRAGSAWSKVNRDKAENMIRMGRMHPAGLAKIEAARREGDWDRLESADALTVPADLAAALRDHPPAEQEWGAFPKSAQRGILEWILQAKQPETRARRILETAQLAARGERALQWRRKDKS